MESLHITGFSSEGYNSDVSPDMLPVNALTTANNAHFLANRVYAIGGYEVKLETTALFDPGHIRFVNAATGSYWVVCGAGVSGSPDDRAIYTYNGSTLTDVSCSVAIYNNLLNPNDWTSCLFNNRPVVNHPQSYPQSQATSLYNTAFVELFWDGATDWAAAGMACGAIASHKNFLFAMNMTEGGSDFPYVVRWSDAADPGALPASWDETVPTNLAGKVPLSAEGGVCLNGASLRDSFIVYRQRSIHAFDFVGGQYVFSVRTISAAVGMVGKHAFTEFNGIHYFISHGDIYQTDGNSIESILSGKARLVFLSTVDQSSLQRAFVFSVPVINEIWFCFPSGSDYVNKAMVYNIKSKTFTTVDMEPTYHAAPGLPSSSVETYDSATAVYDDAFGSYLVSSAGAAVSQVYFCTLEDEATKSKLCAVNTIGFGTDYDFETTLERVSLRLTDADDSNTLLEAYLHHNSTEDIYLTIGTQESPFDAVLWGDEHTVVPGQRKVDIRATGKYFSYKVRSLGKAAWYFVGMTLKYVHDGLR